jgi:hypothetical protein
MATSYKVLGQVSTTSNTTSTLYTVPNATSAVISTIAVCNQNSTSTTFNIAVQPAGATLAAKHYINFRTALPANDTMTISIGITLSSTDVISVSAASTSVSFLAFGSEIV